MRTHEKLTPEHFKDGWVMIVKPGTELLWTGSGWTEDWSEGGKATDEQGLQDELIRMSALNVEGQPIFARTDVVQETEGPDTGKWFVVVIEIVPIMRGEEILRGDQPV